MQDYITRYGMDFNPFIKNTKDIIVETDDYKELSIRLDYLLKNKGFGIITGGPGRGKTTAIRNYIHNLNSSLYKIIYTSLSTLTVSEFYKHLACELGLMVMHKKNDNFRNIQNEITRQCVEKRITPVIIIDEANEPLKQRITLYFNIESLTRDETFSYIRAKLAGAKSTMDIFSPNALEAISNASNGIPRIINKICNCALMIAASKGLDFIDSDIIILAVNDMELA